MPGELETFGLVAFEAAASRRVDRRVHDRAVGAAARPARAHLRARRPDEPAGRDRTRPRRRAEPPRRRPLRRRQPLGARVRRRARRPRSRLVAQIERDACGAACRSARMTGRAVTADARRRLHDVEPATFERCALMRDWLDDLGVARVTLLVIPAPQLHPFPARSPELANWLLDRVDAGDAVAQHGLQHRRTRPPLAARAAAARLAGRRGGRVPRPRRARPRSRRSRPAATCSPAAGLQPRGFVAPGYAYTGALREHLRRPLRLVGDAARACAAAGARDARAHARHEQPAQARGLAGARSAPARRSPGSVLRLDLHPADFDHPRHVLAVERVLDARARPRRGHLRRPVLNAQRRGRPARELARGRPPRRHAVRVHVPVAAPLQAPVVLGLVLSRDRLDATSTASGRKQELRTLLRAGRARRLHPAHRVLAGVAALAPRAAVRDRALSAATPATQSIQTPLLAVAWERVADGDRRASSRRASRRSRPTRAG